MDVTTSEARLGGSGLPHRRSRIDLTQFEAGTSCTRCWRGSALMW